MAPKIAYVASAKRDSSKWGSSLISWGTKDFAPELEPCSHLCIILRKTLVIESTYTSGVRIMPYEHWIKENRVVHSFEKPYEGGLSEYIPDLLRKTWNKPYDYLGVLYFSWRIALAKYFKRPMPKLNKWEDPNKRFCVEIFGNKLSMMSPIQMVAKWKKDPHLKEIEWQE